MVDWCMPWVMSWRQKNMVILDHFCNLWVQEPGGCKSFCKYLRKNIFGKYFRILPGYSRDQVLWIHAKNQK